MTNRQVGDIGEACVIAKFVQLEIPVFLPFNDPGDIDIIAYFNNKLNRIQIKTSSLKQKGSYEVKISSTRNNIRQSKIHKYTKNDIDYFALYNLTRQKVLLIPVEEVGNRTTLKIHIDLSEKLRNQYSKNGRVWEEKDWLIEKVLGIPFQKDLSDKYICPVCGEEMDTYSNDSAKNFCIDCGKPISNKAERCQTCAARLRAEQKYNIEKPNITREEFKKLVRENSILSVGRMFDVSEATIRNWCDYFKLPRRASEIKNFSDEEWEKI